MITKIYANRVRRDFFRLAILSLIIVVIWLVMATYRSLNRSQTPADVKKQLQPLTTTLPLDTIEQMAGRLDSPPIDWGSLNLAAPEILVEKQISTNSASLSGQLKNQ